MSNKKLPYRPNVCLIILNKKNKVFIGERLNSKGHWQFPQGGIEAGASLKENALREAEEETGAKAELFKPIKVLKAINRYDFIKTPDYCVGKFRGQRQKFYVLRFLGKKSDFDLSKDSDPEFSDWKWQKLDKLEKKLEPRRFQGYAQALIELEELINNGEV